MRYDPKKLADIEFNVSRDFESLNFNDAIINQLRSSNYYLNEGVEVRHRIELLNGLFLKTNAKFNNRKSALGLNSPTILSNIVDDAPSEEFDPFQAFISTIKPVSYTHLTLPTIYSV